MQIQDEPDKFAEINIVPMIDVIFAILAFFIIATLYLTRSEGLPVNLPKAASAESQKRSKVTITVEKSGRISVNQQAVKLEKLRATVQAFMKQEQALVILKADEQVNHGRVVAVMDEVRTIKGARLGISTEKPSQAQESEASP